MDDARNTLEFDDHFVIEPAFHFWSREFYTGENGGTPVAPVSSITLPPIRNG